MLQTALKQQKAFFISIMENIDKWKQQSSNERGKNFFYFIGFLKYLLDFYIKT